VRVVAWANVGGGRGRGKWKDESGKMRVISEKIKDKG
jgi:hypothetical protein